MLTEIIERTMSVSNEFTRNKWQMSCELFNKLSLESCQNGKQLVTGESSTTNFHKVAVQDCDDHPLLQAIFIIKFLTWVENDGTVVSLSEETCVQPRGRGGCVKKKFACSSFCTCLENKYKSSQTFEAKRILNHVCYVAHLSQQMSIRPSHVDDETVSELSALSAESRTNLII